ncbi:flagellar basal body rod modification protein [Poriferisphaera corsica]|uniref:Basal-body rod modification protein FlgD n=1 Tax=Poriferisphaera corsica TaxID=2528020 RepID=A0A517YSP7_9BACT|nr:flagellar hook capping FlgD N-terminal domain-containing protein [Poriferisphaera corsica]QDU33172.1 flagellar basal body rod modification protein [Poriferisphaera corsica]
MTTTGVSATGTQSTTSTSSKYTEMDSGQFVKLMVAELTNQDPFEPNDTSALMEQLSSLRNIESQNALQASLESMVSQQSISQASGLIGYEVTGLDDKNNTVTGIVQSIRVVNGKAQLQLNNNKILGMSRVTDIKVPTNTDEEAPLLWDTNADGEVTTDDYNEWYTRWEKNRDKDPEVGSDGKIKTWQFIDGDFTGDGKVDMTDLTLLQRVFAEINNPTTPST